MTKKKTYLLSAALICAMAAGSMFGCADTQTSQSSTQSASRTYMSQVNQVMGTLSDDLDDFVASVSSDDTVSMKVKLNTAMETLDKLSSIDAPDELKDVQAKYKEGSEDLKQALTQYVELYSAASETTPVDAAALAEVQAKYDAGVQILQEADKKASEL